MTPDDNATPPEALDLRELSLRLLAAASRASTARERHDWAEHRRWSLECERWRNLMRPLLPDRATDRDTFRG
jgi:hypothetical protein